MPDEPTNNPGNVPYCGLSRQPLLDEPQASLGACFEKQHATIVQRASQQPAVPCPPRVSYRMIVAARSLSCIAKLGPIHTSVDVCLTNPPWDSLSSAQPEKSCQMGDRIVMVAVPCKT